MPKVFIYARSFLIFLLHSCYQYTCSYPLCFIYLFLAFLIMKQFTFNIFYSLKCIGSPMSSDKYISSCRCHTIIKIQNSSITPLKILSCSFAVNSFPCLQALETTDLFSIPTVFLFLECHVNGIIKRVTFESGILHSVQ